VLENTLSKVKDGPDAPLLFAGDLAVAGNFLEFQKLSTVFDKAFLKNNQDYLLVLEGVTPVADTSFLGKLRDLLNLGARAIVNDRLVDPASTKVKGVVSLTFTKDRVALLPANLEAHLAGVRTALEDVTFDFNTFDVAARNAESAAAYMRATKSLDDQATSTVMELLALARIYANLRRAAPDYSHVQKALSTWLLNQSINLTALSYQRLGIRGLYGAADSKRLLAPVYLPYYLPDDLLLSLYRWQVLTHKILADNGQTSSAVLDDGP